MSPEEPGMFPQSSHSRMSAVPEASLLSHHDSNKWNNFLGLPAELVSDAFKIGWHISFIK